MAERRPRRGRVDAARGAALAVLRAVDEQDAYANLALGEVLRERDLHGRDAALATELVSGTLRGRGSYDAVIDHLVSGTLEPAVRDVLRLGAHQALGMRVPDHAAISTSVDLTRAEVGHRPAGLVNAVLRKVVAHDLQGWMRRLAPDPAADPVGHAALVHSHPRWVVEELGRAVTRPGESTDEHELEALLAADNDRPIVHLVALPGRCDVTDLREPDVPQPPGPYAAALAHGAPGELAAVRSGAARVQDAGSQLVALLAARADLAGVDERWLDLCAGPGGKAALLAALAAQSGVRLTANEVAPHRARLVRQALRGVDADVVVGDGRDGPWDDGSFDRVLLDAPCSGLGALRRRPEARWRRTTEDLSDLVPLQAALLRSALRAVRPGGVVVYATCSPVVAETAEVVREVIADGSADLVPATGLVPEVEDAESVHLPGAMQLWPHRHGTDAMFAAVLRRR